MHETSIDGVPVLWEAGPAPLTAALVFGVGARHESFRTAGVTHMIEHLVMGALPKSPLDCNAEVDLSTTVFHATGRPESVVEFIHRVCAAVSDPPLARLNREAGVLRAEGAISEHPAVAHSLGIRYGFQAQGLAGIEGPGPDQLTERHVRDHAARYFNRGNAVLVLTGEPPASLRLDLPDGHRPEWPTAAHLPLPVPAYLTGVAPIVALTGLVPDDVGPWLGEILVDRVTDELRHKAGVAYDIGHDRVPVDHGQSLLAVWSDGHEDKMESVAQTMWRVLEDLASDGSSAEELSHTRALAREHLDDPRLIPSWLIAQAAWVLRGDTVRSRDEQRALTETMTAAAIQDAGRAMRDTALMLLPEGRFALPALRNLDDLEPPADQPRGEHVHRRRTLSLTPRDLEIRVGQAGFTLTAAGQTGGATWDDIVGVASAEGLRGLVTADGRMFPVLAKSVKQGDLLLARIDELAGDRLFTSTPGEILS